MPLVLSRRKDESLIIGDHIEVKILAIREGGRVSIGISAPWDVRVVRQELLARDRDRRPDV